MVAMRPSSNRRRLRRGDRDGTKADKEPDGKRDRWARRLHGDKDQQREGTKQSESGIRPAGVGVIVGMEEDRRQHRHHADQERRQENDPLGWA